MEIVINDIEKKVNEVLKLIKYDAEKMLEINKIKNAVETLSHTNIEAFSFSFKNELSKNLRKCGAITKLDKSNDKSTYKIILNSDNDMKYQRFSLAHEFGHIILNAPNFENGDFIASFHINYKVNHISKKAYNLDPSLENEEKANIFALLVLMPQDSFIDCVIKYDTIKIAEIFGVTVEAVLSRFDLIKRKLSVQNEY